MHKSSVEAGNDKLKGTGVNNALSRAITRIRRTVPTPENALRLWCRYVTVLKDDLALAQLVAAPAATSECSVDGMTEALSEEDLFKVLRMPDCLTLELPDNESTTGPPQAFLMVPYATDSSQSIDAFRTYFLGTVFDAASLRYTSSEDERVFLQAIDKGNLGYLSEFVSPTSSAATIALLIAAHAIIVDRLFRVPNCILLGKCLEAVRIGSQRNEVGNQPIKRLATTFGVRKIGEATQHRKLSLPVQTPMTAASHNQAQEDEAELVFGLYMGETAQIAHLSSSYAKHLDASVFRT